MSQPQPIPGQPWTLEAAEIDINLLLRGLVHELRNPLSAILTASGLLIHSGELDEESAVLLDIVQKESRRLNRILLEFTAFVKPPSSNPEDFDVATLVEAVLADFETEQLVKPGVEINHQVDSALLAFADKDGTRRALTCLLLNAIEAMPLSGGRIEIDAAAKEGRLRLSIQDEGSGLQEGSEERAFEPFFSTKPQSTGLGLSIARVAAKASGGEIELDNLPEGGSRAVLVLPLSEESGHSLS